MIKMLKTNLIKYMMMKVLMKIGKLIGDNKMNKRIYNKMSKIMMISLMINHANKMIIANISNNNSNNKAMNKLMKLMV